jgi:hypothetical protein
MNPGIILLYSGLRSIDMGLYWVFNLLCILTILVGLRFAWDIVGYIVKHKLYLLPFKAIKAFYSQARKPY